VEYAPSERIVRYSLIRLGRPTKERTRRAPGPSLARHRSCREFLVSESDVVLVSSPGGHSRSPLAVGYHCQPRRRSREGWRQRSGDSKRFRAPTEAHAVRWRFTLRRSWRIRSTPALATTSAPPAAAMSRVAASGARPFHPRNATSTFCVFWRMKTANNSSNSDSTMTAIQVPLVRDRRGVVPIGGLFGPVYSCVALRCRISAFGVRGLVGAHSDSLVEGGSNEQYPDSLPSSHLLVAQSSGCSRSTLVRISPLRSAARSPRSGRCPAPPSVGST
jgi:hypothetical protein